MKTKEFLNFVGKRIKQDTLLAFTCRMTRFAVLSPFVLNRSLQSRGVQDAFQGKHVLQDVQGSKMFLDIADKGLSQDLLLNHIREPYITKVVQKNLRSDDVCLDIGANIGYYVLQEARLSKKVYAIEPVKESVELLLKNVEVNNYKNVEVYQMACGDKNTTDFINVSEKRNWSSMYGSNGREYVRRDEIKVVTVDEFIKDKQRPTFIRMDVEGYEYEIVKGMKNLLDSYSPLKIFIEMHFDILREKTVELALILKEAGFGVSYASIEPHPSIMKNGLMLGVVKFLEKGIGATTGYVDIKIDDLIYNPIYKKGQVEYLEVLFERG